MRAAPRPRRPLRRRRLRVGSPVLRSPELRGAELGRAVLGRALAVRDQLGARADRSQRGGRRRAGRLGVILDEPNDYVVTQPTKGNYKAFTAICTHQQCRVTEVRTNTIFCECHQSEFSIEDGSVVNPPAQDPLEEFPVTVSGANVVIEV